MRTDYDDPNYEAKPVSQNPPPLWRQWLVRTLIVGALVMGFWSARDMLE